MYVQAFLPEPPVKGFDEGVIGRLAGPLEVEAHVARIGP
jgi:hypothetical protein